MSNKSKLKKLRGKGYVEVSPAIERWRRLRKELGLHKPARKNQPKRYKEEVIDLGDVDPWSMFKKDTQ